MIGVTSIYDPADVQMSTPIAGSACAVALQKKILGRLIKQDDWWSLPLHKTPVKSQVFLFNQPGVPMQTLPQTTL